MAGKTKTEKTFNQRGCTLKKKKKTRSKVNESSTTGSPTLLPQMEFLQQGKRERGALRDGFIGEMGR